MKAGVEHVPGANCSNDEGQLDDGFVTEMLPSQFKVFVAGAALGQRVDGFCPVKRGAFGLAKEAGGFAPSRKRINVPWVCTLPDQVGPVHVDTKGAAIDLADAQVHQLFQAFVQGAACRK